MIGLHFANTNKHRVSETHTNAETGTETSAEIAVEMRKRGCSHYGAKARTQRRLY
jgi:hypothetical protein